MTETQKQAIEDLKYIVEDAQALIKKLQDNEIDNIQDDTMKAYRILSDLM